MKSLLELTSREIQEIHHALVYEYRWAHGTVGHNMLIIIAKLSRSQGFELDDNLELKIPDSVVVTN